MSENKQKVDSMAPLKVVAQRLEKIQEEVQRNQGYNSDTEILRMLVELAKEQVQNEDSSHTAR